MKEIMITESKQPNVLGYNEMELAIQWNGIVDQWNGIGDRINWWRGFVSVESFQRLDLSSSVHANVLRKRLMLYVRTSTLLHYNHLLLLKCLTNYIWNYNILDSHTYHELSDTPRSEDIVYVY